MSIIKKPSAVDSPYVVPTPTAPTRLASSPIAGGGVNTVAATATPTASVDANANVNTASNSTGSNVSYYTAGIEGVNELATYGRVFAGANVYVTLEQPQYITYNQNYTGSGTVGGANGQIQFNDNGLFAGSANLTFDGSNLVVGGKITTSQLSTTGSVIGGNLFTAGKVSAIGNITGNYFIGNGSQLTGIATSTGNIGFSGDAIYDLNGIYLENADLSHGATAALILPGNGNTSPIQINNTYGNIVLQTGVTSNVIGQWKFDNTGTLTFPNNSGCTWPVTQQRYGMGNIGAWLDGEWTIGEFSGNGVQGQVGIRIDPGIEGYTGMTFPGSLNSNTQPVYIYSSNGGGIQLNTGGGNTWTFDSTGNLNLPGPLVGPADNQLALFSNTDIRLQAKIRGTGEPFNGGRLFLLGGQGSTGNANAGPTGGGYTRLYSGSGGAASAGNTAGAGSGGYMRVRAGGGGDASDVGPAGNGGYLQFRAGSAGYNNGNTDLGASGGDVEITAGYSTGSFQNGGTISVNTGGADYGLPGAFQINIPIGANVPGPGNTPGGTWSFDGSGTVLSVPQNAQIYAPSFGNITVGAAGNTFITSSDYIGNTYTWQFGSTGSLSLPITASDPWGVIQTANAYPELLAYGSGGHGGPEFDWMNADDPANTFGNVNTLRNTMYLNGSGLFVGLNENETPGHVIGHLAFDQHANLNVSGNIITEGAGGDIVMSNGNIVGANNIVLANSITTTGSAGNITMTGGNITGVNTVSLSSVVGNVTRPGYLTWVANSSGDGYNFTTAHLMPDQGVGGDAYLIIDPTYPNHLHLRGGGTQDNSGVQLFLGGENSHFMIDSGSNPAVYARANSYNWTFGTNGTLTAPGNITTANSVIANTFVGDQANVELVAGVYTWTLDDNGLLSAPGDISTTGNVSAQKGTFSGNIAGAGRLDIDSDATIGGNLFVTGNINFSGNVTQISGNSGVFYGNASTGVGALYAGKTGYTPLPNTVIQITGDDNSYVQVNLQNTNHGNVASMELAITADDGTDTTNYIDMGIAGSTWDGTQTNSLGTAVNRRDGYLYVQGGSAGGNLVLGTTTAGYSIKFNAGGPNSTNTVAAISSTGFSTSGNVTAAKFFGDGGALSNITVTGSAPVSTTGNVAGGNLISTGTVSASGNITANNIIANNIGNVAALNLNGNASTVLYGNGVFAAVSGGGGGSYGDSNVVSLLGAFGSNTVSTSGNITSGNINTGGQVSATGNITGGNIITAGTATITGNVTTTGYFISGNQATGGFKLGNVNSRITAGGSNSYATFGQNISLFPDTGLSALAGVLIGGSGYLLAPSGGRVITLGNDSSASFTGNINQSLGITQYFNTSGQISATGNITIGGSITRSGIVSQPAWTTSGIGLKLSGATYGDLTTAAGTLPASYIHVMGAPSMSFSNVVTVTNAVTLQIAAPTAGTNATLTNPMALLANGAVSVTGNITVGNVNTAGQLSATGNVAGGNLITSGQVSATGNVTASGAVFSGNVTAGNISGNISITGNITGTSSNVSLVAGSYTYTFDNTGNLTMPANSDVVFGANTTLTSVSGSNGNITVNPDGTGLFVVTAITPAVFGNTVNVSGNVTVSGTGGVITPNRPAFRVYGNGVTNVSTTTNTNGILNGNNWAVDYNQGSYLNSTTGTFTAPVAGLYQVNLNMRIANNTAPLAQAIVIKNYGSTNATQVMWEAGPNPTINHFGVSTVSKLAANDTLIVKVAVGALTFDANDSWSVAFLG